MRSSGSSAPLTTRSQSSVCSSRRASDLSEHLVLALAAGELGTWHWNLASGVTEWDSTMERIFGLEPGTFDGTFERWVSLIHPDDVDETVATLERAVANRSAYEVEHRVIWGDGTVHWLQGRGTVTLDSDGNVTGTIGCTSDITPRKRLELEATRQVRAGRRRRATGACAARATRVPRGDQPGRSLRPGLSPADEGRDRGGSAPARRLVHAALPSRTRGSARGRARARRSDEGGVGGADATAVPLRPGRIAWRPRRDPHWSPRVPEGGHARVRQRCARCGGRRRSQAGRRPRPRSTSCSSRASSPCPSTPTGARSERCSSSAPSRDASTTTRTSRSHKRPPGASPKRWTTCGSPSSTARSPASCRPHCFLLVSRRSTG